MFKLFHQFIFFVVQVLDFWSLLFQTASMLQVMVFNRWPGMIVMSRMFDNDNIQIKNVGTNKLTWLFHGLLLKLKFPVQAIHSRSWSGCLGSDNFFPLMEHPSSFFVVDKAILKWDILQHVIYVPQDSSSGLLWLSRVDRVHIRNMPGHLPSTVSLGLEKKYFHLANENHNFHY